MPALPKNLTARLTWRGLLLLGSLLAACAASAAEAPAATPDTSAGWTLDQCLKVALETNRRRPASRQAVAAAEAQHRQVLSAYWPQVNASGGYQRQDQAPNFLFPSAAIAVPAQSISTPGGAAMVTVPAGVLGPTAVQLPVTFPGQTIVTPAQTMPIPEQNIRLMNPDSYLASVHATWLLYDGGMRKGLRDQARAGVDAARQDARRTDLEIVDSVKRLYHGAVLARQLHQLGKDTLARMGATLNLTETMYKEGSGRVKKTDFLDNKIMVDSLRSMVALLEKNETMAQCALAYTIGLPWNASVTPADREMPHTPFTGNLEQLVAGAYQLNPDWNKLEAGLRAAEGAVLHARSGHQPKIALTGEVHKWWNSYHAGMATDRNKEGSSIGLGVELPLFDGFLTRNKIAEARARLQKLKEQQILLKEGLGIQIKDLFLGLQAAQKSYQATLDAANAAQENRDLNTRAYQNELVETEKVIRAQLMEALMSAQHLKTRYDFLALQSQLDVLIGAELLRQLGAN
ncbi:MAG: TolC family protein [Opitutae bacterium]|nr:TolC family protein [Opitutae bacterium]